MSLSQLLRGASLASALLLWMAAESAVLAAGIDYEFQLVEGTFKEGLSVVAVRLVDKRSGKVVPDAVIFATRLDMEPDGMEMMTTPVEALPSMEPGIYSFKAALTMAGGWRLSLAAKVQGEAETVEGKLVIKAIP